MPSNCLALYTAFSRYKLTSQSNPIWLVVPPPVTRYYAHCIDGETVAQGCYRNCPKWLTSRVAEQDF